MERDLHPLKWMERNALPYLMLASQRGCTLLEDFLGLAEVLKSSIGQNGNLADLVVPLTVCDHVAELAGLMKCASLQPPNFCQKFGKSAARVEAALSARALAHLLVVVLASV